MYLKYLFSKYKESYITFFPKKHIKSIVGVKSFIKNSSGQLLLIQRSKDDRHSPLLWEFPGGSVRKKESLRNTVIREIREETNLTIKLINEKCYVYFEDIPSNISAIYSGFRRYVFIYNVYVNKNLDIKLSKEHATYLWCTINEALKMPLTKCTREYLLKCSD